MQTFLLLVVLAHCVLGHTTVQELFVNGKSQGDGQNLYIRSPVAPPASDTVKLSANGPVKDLTSTDLTCNNNNKQVSKWITVSPGDEVAFQWYHDDHSVGDIIASSHDGPVMTYIAPATAGTAGSGWLKIAEEGFTNGKSAVYHLIQDKGIHKAKLPSTLPVGKYLLRPEIIALHEANELFSQNPARGAQFYMECVQVEVKASSASKALPAGVRIPGIYKDTDPGIHFNLYNGAVTSYPIPGPKLFNAGAATPSSQTSRASSAPSSRTSSRKSTSRHVSTHSSRRPTSTRRATASPVASPNKPAGGCVDYNACMREWNGCLAKQQSPNGGQVDFSPCDSLKATCDSCQRKRMLAYQG